MSAFLWTIQCWFAVHIVLSIIGMAKGSIGEVPDTGVDRSVRALFLVCEVAFVCWSIFLLDRMP